MLFLSPIIFLSFFVVGSAVRAQTGNGATDPLENNSKFTSDQTRNLRIDRALPTCGNGSRGDGVCANGQCCSQYGWCGTTSAHCSGSGSTGTCGNGSRGNGVCANGQCCSQYGWCGTTSAHCGGSAPVPVSLPAPAPVGGTCGNGSRGNGVCANGRCCSQYGWCGTTSAHCSGGPVAPAPAPAPAPVSSGSGGCSPGWKPAGWTYYLSYAPCCLNSPNYDPNADRTECDVYSACSYTGQFAYIGYKSPDYVKNNSLISFFSTFRDNASFGGKTIQISAGGKTITALIADTCGDSDCGGCCTKNAGSSGYLVDMEINTVIKHFGSTGAVGGIVCWKLA